MSSSHTPNFNFDTTLKSLVIQYPESASILEKHQLDFCCKGDRKLIVACENSETMAQNILNEIQESAEKRNKDGNEMKNRKIPAEMSAQELVDWIVAEYHEKLRRDVPVIKQLASKVARVHGGKHPELKKLEEVVLPTADTLLEHIGDEEERLFKMIKEVEKGDEQQFRLDVQKELDTLEEDHRAVGKALEDMRTLSNGFQVPHDACGSYSRLYALLAELERDTHEHVHAENYVLFPMCLQMQSKHDQH